MNVYRSKVDVDKSRSIFNTEPDKWFVGHRVRGVAGFAGSRLAFKHHCTYQITQPTTRRDSRISRWPFP
jgi:hypothetical protein